MKCVGALLILSAACGSGAGDDEYPVTPPGGGGADNGSDGSGSNRGDGGIDAPDQLTGRACVLGDLRKLTLCADTGAKDLTVALGTSTTTTTDDRGTFVIARPEGTNLQWRISKANTVITSIVPFGTSNLVPVVTAADYGDLLLTNGVLIQAGQGSLVVKLVTASQAATGAKASLTGDVDEPTLYDDPASSTIWATVGGAGPLGVAWLPARDVATGTRELRLTPSGGSTSSPAGVLPVVDQAITFATVVVP